MCVFSQTTEYALRAMAMLAHEPQRIVSTPELAHATRAPQNYLAKVLQQLAASGLVRGRRGIGGGYRLARPAGDIRLMDVIDAVSVVKRIESCPLGLDSHAAGLCALHRLEDRVAKAVIEVYADHTLADLLGDGAGSRPLCESPPGAQVTVSSRPDPGGAPAGTSGER